VKEYRGQAPLVSCVVSVYNAERYLAAALESILGQTHPAIEVIVADDGSTDASRAIAERHGARVRWVTQPTAGPAATRNLGLRASRGELIAFLDADDRWHPEKLARQVARLAARPEVEVSLTHVQLFWDDPECEEARCYRDHPRAGGVPGFATTTLLARRRAFDVVGLLDAGLWFADSVDWFLRARAHGLVLEVLPEVLAYHRMHAGNLTRRREGASREEFLRVVRAGLARRRAGRGPAAD
jgi:glycosyltransferase involved in cell wall biosynthesis